MGLYSPNDKFRRVPIPDKLGLSREPFRTDWRRDYARIIHSASFRRLQGKTQLFPYFESDFFRNRLTHSLEVAQIAKSIAIRINNTVEFFKNAEFNTEPDVPEIAGLAHDLGHPPFGHNGEKALDDYMKPYGGFEGNAQTFRILTKIEKRQKKANSSEYGIGKDGDDRRLGLNLTYRTLAAILKYDRSIPKKRKKDDELVKGYYHSEESI
ncbi:MAG: deoxyguanosinetriphosphate triphosphohydrolase family protein [Thermodesulfobacteriota bacterium]